MMRIPDSLPRPVVPNPPDPADRGETFPRVSPFALTGDMRLTMNGRRWFAALDARGRRARGNSRPGRPTTAFSTGPGTGRPGSFRIR